MVSRPRSHVLGHLAVSRLVQEITALGWTCEKISHDYGEDLLVRIFEGGKVTPYLFFIQSKSTDNIKRYLTKFGQYKYPLNRRHIKQWLSYQQPVVITLYDSKSDRFLWQEIQYYMGHIWIDKKNIKSSILFPPNKVLNRASLEGDDSDNSSVQV